MSALGESEIGREGSAPPRQLAFDLPARPALSRGVFHISAPNREALGLIDAWRDWPQLRLAVVGPEGAGKTHLAEVWRAMTGAAKVCPGGLHGRLDILAEPLVVDAADRIAELGEEMRDIEEEALFHILNRQAQAGTPLLFTARLAPAHWEIALPDLKSRLETVALTRISPPDDALLSCLLYKLFADRQLAVGDGAIAFLVKRMERSFAAAGNLVTLLDREALSRKRPVTIPLIKEVTGWTD